MKLHQVFTQVRGPMWAETLNYTCYGVKAFTVTTRAQPIVTDPLVPPVLPAADVQHVTQLPQTSTVKLASPKQLSLHPDLVPMEQLEELAELQGKLCVVRYLGNIYPGIVTNIDDVDIEDKYTNSVGVNRFSWPQYRDDGCWYTVEDGLFVIPEP